MIFINNYLITVMMIIMMIFAYNEYIITTSNQCEFCQIPGMHDNKGRLFASLELAISS